jgi:hypothetical protein
VWLQTVETLISKDLCDLVLSSGESLLAATAFGRKRLQSVRINAVLMLLTKDNRQVNTILFFFETVL